MSEMTREQVEEICMAIHRECEEDEIIRHMLHQLQNSDAAQRERIKHLEKAYKGIWSKLLDAEERYRQQREQLAAMKAYKGGR